MSRIIKPMLILALVLLPAFAACSVDDRAEAPAEYSIHTLQADENGLIAIDAGGISQTAGYYNFDAEGITVQLVALRDNDGRPHIAFNTCQSCSPSPKAYFLQTGELLECQNCKNLFSAYEVGIESGGCNPWPIDGAEITDEWIRIPSASLEAMAPAFVNWGGPKE